jgi:hypothetical protein
MHASSLHYRTEVPGRPGIAAALRRKLGGSGIWPPGTLIASLLSKFAIVEGARVFGSECRAVWLEFPPSVGNLS